MKKITYRITPTAFSFFTGGGGMDIGAKRAGVKILLGADYDKFPGIIHANNTKENNPGLAEEKQSQGIFLSGEEGDITKMKGAKIMKLNLTTGRIDLIFGGPPCPPFSIANPFRGPFEKRATLIFYMLRLIRQIKPKVVIIEQVPQIKSPAIRPLWNKLVTVLDNMTDYYWDHEVLNAMHYGGRQNRKRRIFMLVDKSLGVKPSFPQPQPPDFTKVSAQALLPHITHFSSGQGANVIHSAKNRMFLTITAGASEWVYKGGEPRKLFLPEKQILTETEGMDYSGLTQTQANTAQGNMVSASLMDAICRHVITHILKYA